MAKKNLWINSISAILIFSLFLLWGMRGRFWILFTAFFPNFHITLLISTIFFSAGFMFFRKQMFSAFNTLVRRRYWIFPLLSFVFTTLVTIYIFEAIPHVIDASHFLWTARLLTRGQLSLPAPELYEHYRNTFSVLYNGRYFSLFLPGFSFFLLPFVILGVPYLACPLSTALSVVFTGLISRRLFNDKVSFFSMMLMTFSSFYIFMGASFMAHPFTMMLSLLSVWMLVKKPRGLLSILISGACLGWVLFIRPQNAVFVGAPLGIYLAFSSESLKDFIKSATIFVLPGFISGILLLIYNLIFTGEMFVFPQDIYFSVREPVEFCHRMGLGKGCPNTEGIYLPDGGLNFSYAFWVSYVRLTQLIFNIATHPYLLLFAAAAFFISWKRHVFLFSIFMVSFLGYFFFYLPGNLFGPRYFTETTPFVIVTASSAFFHILRRSRKIIPLRAFLVSLPVAAFIYLAAFIMPELLSSYSQSFWGVDNSIYEKIRERGISDSIIFVPGKRPAMVLNLMKNPPHDKYGNLILTDLEKQNRYSAAYYMEKGDYSGAWEVQYIQTIEEKVQISPLYHYETDRVWIEFEHKRKPVDGNIKYAVTFSTSESRPKRFFPVGRLGTGINLSNGNSLALLFHEEPLEDDHYYGFTHHILNPGDYEVTMAFVKSHCSGSFGMEVNGKEETVLKAFRGELSHSEVKFKTNLKKGLNEFRIRPRKPGSCLILDYIMMEKLYFE